MIIYLKDILKKVFSFNGYEKIINASLKYLTKVPTQKAKFNLYKNQTYIDKEKEKIFWFVLFWKFVD